MPSVADQADSFPPLPLPRSSSEAHSDSRPPVCVGATGSILSLVDLERCGAAVDVSGSSPPDQRFWSLSGRSRSTGGLLRGGIQRGLVPYRLETVAEVNVKVPKWKQFLSRFRKGAAKNDGLKGSKPGRTATTVEVPQQSGAETRRDKQAKVAALRDGRVSAVTANPRPLPKPSEKSSSSLWERRNVAQISPLDLTRLRRSKPAKAL